MKYSRDIPMKSVKLFDAGEDLFAAGHFVVAVEELFTLAVKCGGGLRKFVL
jgi:hypothetical protein